MKYFIFFCICCLPLLLAAQPQADSLISRQLLRQKKQLNLSDAQFVEYKKKSLDYRAKMGKLTAQTTDTAEFVAKARAIVKSYKSDLKKILTQEQFQQYKDAEGNAWRQFEKKTKEDHINVNGKAKD